MQFSVFYSKCKRMAYKVTNSPNGHRKTIHHFALTCQNVRAAAHIDISCDLVAPLRWRTISE